MAPRAPSPRGEDHAGANDGEAATQRRGGLGRLLPLPADHAQKVRPGRGVLRQLLIAVRAVVADGRALHEDPGADGGGFDGEDRILGAVNPAIADLPLDLRVPALAEQVVTGQIDHRVTSVDRPFPASADGGISTDDLRALELRFEAGLLRSAGEDDRHVSAIQETTGQLSANLTGAAGEKYAHQPLPPTADAKVDIPSTPGMARPWKIPHLAATAGEASRSRFPGRKTRVRQRILAEGAGAWWRPLRWKRGQAPALRFACSGASPLFHLRCQKPLAHPQNQVRPRILAAYRSGGRGPSSYPGREASTRVPCYAVHCVIGMTRKMDGFRRAFRTCPRGRGHGTLAIAHFNVKAFWSIVCAELRFISAGGVGCHALAKREHVRRGGWGPDSGSVRGKNPGTTPTPFNSKSKKLGWFTEVVAVVCQIEAAGSRRLALKRREPEIPGSQPECSPP